MTAKKLLQIISTILVALAVLLAVALVGVRLAGIRTFTVLFGSMEPTYHVGSLIYVKKVDSTAIRPGQVITFMLDENTVATHRVVEVVPDEDDPSTLRFRTKGDANDAEDGSLVHYKNVIGTPVFAIPKLGYAANYIQHPPGLYVALSAGAEPAAGHADDRRLQHDAPEQLLVRKAQAPQIQPAQEGTFRLGQLCAGHVLFTNSDAKAMFCSR